LPPALAAAGVECESIGYIEAHGSATVMGDPIEIEALNQVYGQPDSPSSIAVDRSRATLAI
jgi:acyl transferase domain-containing protein